MPSTTQPDWDEVYDVIVVGSGNGGLTAAITAHDGGAKVLVVEKAEHIGGTSASSGGGVWVPNNRYAKAVGANDSDTEARDYLAATTPKDRSEKDTVDPAMLKTYVTRAPEMIDYLHQHTDWVRYVTLEHYPDYFPEAPGGKTGHRSMEPEPLHAKVLGDDFSRIAKQHPQTQMPFGVNFTQVEGQLILSAIPGWIGAAAKLYLTYFTDLWARIRTLRDARLTLGSCGIARLFLSLRDRGVSVWTGAPMQSLVSDAGKVLGIVVEKDGQQMRIKANKGVVLAAGGFERNQQMREQYLPNPTKAEWSAANLYNTGDAIQAGISLGAATAQMDWAWWFTTAVIPTEEKGHMSQVEKGMPGSITVNRHGKRFSNESQNYVTFVEDSLKPDEQGERAIPNYMIFDANFRKQRPIAGALLQGKLFPDWIIPKSWWTPSFLSKGDTLSELASKVGIDASGLEQTVATFNDYAKSGKDLDFQRGHSSYDRYYSDPTVTPNPCLGPILKPPFYCVTLYAGEMGTAGGLKINTDAQVLKEDGAIIEGLYACGNTTSALLPSYPGPGSTLGPAMTFGYLAGLKLTETVS